MEREAGKSSEKRNEKQNFIFTIKIVSAEDLKPCDVNGLSDPYVVLSDEHGRRIAKTRTIWGDLNPRWDETFDVATTGSLWLAATVWDRDRMVSNHDLCGRCYVKLDPGFFGDYLPRVCQSFACSEHSGSVARFGHAGEVAAASKYGRRKGRYPILLWSRIPSIEASRERHVKESC